MTTTNVVVSGYAVNMAANPTRRAALADAAISVLATDGARGLTHRAVDRAAGTPTGTSSNYFPTRDALYDAIAHRIYDRLAGDAPAEADAEPPSRERLHALIADIVDRVTAQPQLTVALLELRLEASRRPELRAAMTAFLREQFDRDVTFHTAAGLDGGADEVLLLHVAFDGLMLDQLLTPGALPIADRSALVRRLVDRLVPASVAGER
jgi:DNA-binding transcriptional regulator YbjK